MAEAVLSKDDTIDSDEHWFTVAINQEVKQEQRGKED
jgi:hypothetical protein